MARHVGLLLLIVAIVVAHAFEIHRFVLGVAHAAEHEESAVVHVHLNDQDRQCHNSGVEDRCTGNPDEHDHDENRITCQLSIAIIVNQGSIDCSAAAHVPTRRETASLIQPPAPFTPPPEQQT